MRPNVSVRRRYEHRDLAVHHVAYCVAKQRTDREMLVGASEQLALTTFFPERLGAAAVLIAGLVGIIHMHDDGGSPVLGDLWALKGCFGARHIVPDPPID
jgi:hypothetical protein